MTEEQLQAIKGEYSNMNWEDFRENAGDLMQREIDIYDSVVIDGVPALIAEVERLRKELVHVRELWRYGSPSEIYENLPRIAQMILNNEKGEWIG